MENNVKTWKPKVWVAVLIGIFTTNFTFLYLNRAKLFWLYLVVFFVGIIAALYLNISQTIFVVLPLICAIHAYKIAKSAQPQAKRWYARFWWVLYLLTLTLVVSIRLYVFELFILPSMSMAPNYTVGSVVITKKFAIEPKPGRVYALYEAKSNGIYLKRLIGLPGDKLSFSDDKISINGEEVKRSLVNNQNDTTIYQETLGNISYLVEYSDYQNPYPNGSVVLAENEYFFIGDNRNNSADSRLWGTVPIENIIGEVVYKIEPISNRSSIYSTD